MPQANAATGDAAAALPVSTSLLAVRTVNEVVKAQTNKVSRHA